MSFLLRTVRAATSTYGDTYYDKRRKTEGAQVALPGTAGDHDTDTDLKSASSEQKSDIRKAERKGTAGVCRPRQVSYSKGRSHRVYHRARRRDAAGQIQNGQP